MTSKELCLYEKEGIFWDVGFVPFFFFFFFFFFSFFFLAVLIYGIRANGYVKGYGLRGYGNEGIEGD